MKKGILSSIVALAAFGLFFAGTFSSKTTDNTAQLIHAGVTTVDMVSVFNPGSDTLCVYMYDTPSTPSATSTIFQPFLCPPGTQTFGGFSTPFLKFTQNCYIRTVKKPTAPANITAILTSTISPSYYPQINAHY